MSPCKWTKDRILLEIRRRHARGESLAVRQLRRVGLGGMVTTAYRLFGAWREAVSQAGVQASPAYRPRKWSLERILAEIRRLAAEGHDVSFSAVRRDHPRLVSAAYRHRELGNWGRALVAAGVVSDLQERQTWTQAAIVEQIAAMAARGESLASGAVRKRHPRLFGAACSPRHFGSWRTAVEAAGLDYQQVRRRHPWTRERVLATIKALHAQGNPLTTPALRRAGHSGLLAAARKPTMFGSWREAVECAGIDYEEVRRASRRAAALAEGIGTDGGAPGAVQPAPVVVTQIGDDRADTYG